MCFRDLNRTDRVLNKSTEITFKNICILKLSCLSLLVNIVTLLSSPAFSEKLIFDDDETVPGI